MPAKKDTSSVDPRAVIGIDPGKKGGLACINYMGELTFIPMPMDGNELDVITILRWVAAIKYKYPKVIAVIEKVGAMPDQGVVGMFNFGMGAGILRGIIIGREIPFVLVAPQTWKATILRDTKKDKDAAIQSVKALYPEIELLATPRSKKEHDGIADAVCMARYGWLSVAWQ